MDSEKIYFEMYWKIVLLWCNGTCT